MPRKVAVCIVLLLSACSRIVDSSEPQTVLVAIDDQQVILRVEGLQRRQAVDEQANGACAAYGKRAVYPKVLLKLGFNAANYVSYLCVGNGTEPTEVPPIAKPYKGGRRGTLLPDDTWEKTFIKFRSMVFDAIPNCNEFFVHEAEAISGRKEDDTSIWREQWKVYECGQKVLYTIEFDHPDKGGFGMTVLPKLERW